MHSTSLEIKVALLGNVSAGKTTVLNALLRDKYGQVAMKRTTAGANYFRLYPKEGAQNQNWSMTPEDPRSAQSTLREITEDNQFKISKDQSVLEKYFDIEVDEPLVRCRKDVKLVLVDIPGINEAGTDNKYKEYVTLKWDTFDCAVVVMDGKQGVNTEDQVFLLKLVKQNLVKKDIPVIVLCNKFDDPDDEELMEIVNEAKLEVEKIFKPPNPFLKKSNVHFFPVSAINAYIHQCASKMTLEQFRNFDKDLIEKMGREQIGRKRWTKMQPEEKVIEAHRIVTDPETYEAALHESNFDKFLNSLDSCIGGDETQLKIIEKQVHISFATMSEKPYQVGKIIGKLKMLHSMIKYLSGSMDVGMLVVNLKKSFWVAYAKFEDFYFEQFRSSFCLHRSVILLDEPMKELKEYFEFFADNEKVEVLEKTKAFVRRLLLFLVNEFHGLMKKTNSNDTLCRTNSNDTSKSDLYSNFIMNPSDWKVVWKSLLLMSYDKCFCRVFGPEKMLLEELHRDAEAYEEKCECSRTKCIFCGWNTTEIAEIANCGKGFTWGGGGLLLPFLLLSLALAVWLGIAHA